MSGTRKVIIMRLATSHPFEAYGDTHAMQDDELEEIALRARENRLPLNIGHDLTRPLNERYISVTVVDLDDGYKAVEAEVEVDGDAWDLFDRQREDRGAPGGLSITVARYFAQLPRPSDSSNENSVSVTADGAHFTRSDLVSAAAGLNPLGVVEVGLLYQFADMPSCRIVIDFVQQSPVPGLLSQGVSVATGAIGSLISVAIVKLMSKAKRRAIPTSSDSAEGLDASRLVQTQIEVIVRHNSDGSISKILQVRTDKAEIVNRAFSVFEEALLNDVKCLVWDELRNRWTTPNAEGDK